jgi:hypothetical protein
MLELFGLKDTVAHLLGGQVNQLHNVMTMQQGFHHEFDLMNLWLEPVSGQVSRTPLSALPLLTTVK